MKKFVNAFVLTAILACPAVYLNYFSSFVFPWQQNEAIQATLNWGGLAKLPQNVQNLEIERRGSAFTRQFIIQFDSDEKQIGNWIKNSKRLKDNSPKIRAQQKIYEIYPGENDSFGGKVIITKSKVLINMSWS